MKILHTSDWHLGRSLFGRKRDAEFAAFLNWLAETIEQQGIDALLVAGDVFDSSAPSHRAQELYYRFLCRIAGSACRHLVLIAGNHDSPSFLNAPKELLRALDVHVVGAVPEDLEDEVIVLKDPAGAPELIVCATPYLRDRDIRQVEAGETVEDKDRKLLEGIRVHYAKVAELAEAQRQASGGTPPIVGMGHLFTAGGQTIEGDGVRELYVGSLAHVSAGIFPESFDYLALGHLHVPQRVGGSERIRYSGSPLPMGFGEAGQQKSVCVVEFGPNSNREGGLQPHGPAQDAPRQTPPPADDVSGPAAIATQVRLLEIPVFQRLERIRGDWETISARLAELSTANQSIWLEVAYEGEALMSDLRERLEQAAAGGFLEILRVKNSRVMRNILERAHPEETLDDLNPNQVFERCLEARGVGEDQRAELRRSYAEILDQVRTG